MSSTTPTPALEREAKPESTPSASRGPVATFILFLATVETVVFAASAGDVTDVVIDGRVVVTDRRHVGVDPVAELGDAIFDLMGVRPEALRANS